MKELYNEVQNYISSNPAIIELIESETYDLQQDITAMWVAGYIRRELEKFTGKEKADPYYVQRMAIESLTLTQSIDTHWNNFSKVEDFLVDAYKAGYDTRENKELELKSDNIITEKDNADLDFYRHCKFWMDFNKTEETNGKL